MRRSGLALRGIFAVSTSLLSSASQAQDGGVLMVFGLENRLEISRNVGLSVPAGGTDVIDVTRLSFGLLTETEIDRLQFSASGALIVGNPSDGGTDFEVGRGLATLDYRREVPSAVFDMGATFRSDNIDEFDDALSDLDETGTRADYGLSAGLEIGRTSSVGLAFGGGYEATEYQNASDPELFDSTEARARAAVIFRFSETITGNIGARYVDREEEDLASTRTETISAFAGLDYALSERIGLSAEISFSEVETIEFGVAEQRNDSELSFGLTYEMPSATIAGRLGVAHTDGAGTDLIGSLRVDQELPDGGIVLELERAVRFDDELTTTSSAAVSWTKSVDEISSVSLDIRYDLSDAPSERIEQVTFGADYSRELTADWMLSGGVDYRVRDDADGRAQSPTVFVSLSRDFEFRP